MQKLNEKTKKTLKICVVSALGALNAYLIYSLIVHLVVWQRQPVFVLADGSSTRSLGFLVQMSVFGGIFLLAATALVVLSILFFKKKGKKNIDKNSTLGN